MIKREPPEAPDPALFLLMNVAGPSRRGVSTRKRGESRYERDLLALLDQLSPNELDGVETLFTHRADTGKQLSDQDVATSDLLQQARALAALNQDRVLAERIATGDPDEFGLEFQRPPIVEAPRVAVPRPTWRRRWALVSKISRRFRVHSRTAIRRNGNEQPMR